MTRLIARQAARAITRRDHGQASVELALCMPILMVLLTGIWSYGMAVNNYVTLAEATGAGARKIAISRGQGGDPCAIAASTVQADAPSLSQTGSTVSGLGYSITVAGQTYASATPQCPNATLTAGQPVSITVTYPCTLQIFRVAALANCYLTAKTTEVIQ